MLKGIISNRYYLFSLSNLIAAFGGGLILGKGAGIIDLYYLHGGSVLAFFIGTILGLAFLQFIPERSSNVLAQFFSICCGITSLILFYIYQKYAYESKLDGGAALIFFMLLSIRFGFWFYSRVMRASKASGHNQSIAWVEMGYYLGMVLGLVIWKFLGVNIALGTALIIDACFQFIAGILDFRSNALPDASCEESRQEIQIFSEIQSVQYNSKWCWKLAGAVVLITIGVQVVIFSASHYVADVFSSYIIAAFYFGVAVAAFVCNKYKIYIAWDPSNNLAYIYANNTRNKIKCGLSLLVLISAMAVIIAVYTIHLNQLNLMTYDNSSNLFVCFFVFLAAFVYEVITLAILDRLGYEEKKIQRSGMIMRTYGLMGLGAAISLWILGFMDNHYTSSIITVGICLAFSTGFILKRNVTIHNNRQGCPI